LDAAGGELTDVVGHAIAAREADYACWIAEGFTDYFIRQDRYHECRAALESSLPLVDAVTDRRMTSSLRTCLGIAYGMQGSQEQAHACFAAALRNSQRSGDIREQARARGGLGLVAEVRGRLAEAAEELTEVLELARPLDDDWLLGMAMFHLGMIHHRSGERDKSLDFLAASMACAEKIGSPRPIAKTLCYISVLHLDVGQYAEAVALLRRAADVAEDAGDRSLRALSLTRLGSAEQGLGNLDRAVELHHQALVAITEQTNVETEIEVRNRLGDTYLATGDGTKAREQFKLVLDLVGDSGNPEERSRALHGLDRSI
ncbi:MAG: tetratricopeptide repeat protein, partial [Mycobacteriales bacterium]